MMGKRIVLWTALLGLLAVGSLGCARHVVHHHPHGRHAVKHVTVLENEHTDEKVVVVHTRPKPKRHCWKHRRHWHCRGR